MKCVTLVISLLAILPINQCLPVCFGLENGTVLPHPEKENEYYLCFEDIPIPMQCPAGRVFCREESSCLEKCAETPDICEGQSDSIIFGLPGSCSGYITCKNEQSQINYCLENKKFDPVTGSCTNETCP